MAPIPKLSVLQVHNVYSACTLNAKWSWKNFEDRKISKIDALVQGLP